MEKKLCSFCGKPYRECGMMVEAPNDRFICKGCAALCLKMFTEEERKKGEGATGGKEQVAGLKLPVPGPLDMLLGIAEGSKTVTDAQAYLEENYPDLCEVSEIVKKKKW